jgi:hypothetical protein
MSLAQRTAPAPSSPHVLYDLEALATSNAEDFPALRATRSVPQADSASSIGADGSICQLLHEASNHAPYYAQSDLQTPAAKTCSQPAAKRENAPPSVSLAKHLCCRRGGIDFSQ